MGSLFKRRKQVDQAPTLDQASAMPRNLYVVEPTPDWIERRASLSPDSQGKFIRAGGVILMAANRDGIFHEDIAKGIPELAEKMAEEIRLEREMGYRILSHADVDLSDAGWWNLRSATVDGPSVILLNRFSSVYGAADDDGRQRSADALKQALDTDSINVIAATAF
jgi:hypothetical protein